MIPSTSCARVAEDVPWDCAAAVMIFLVVARTAAGEKCLLPQAIGNMTHEARVQ
jgi:hypothetical protein